MWVAAQDPPRSAAHPFYTRLNQILNTHDFDGYVEGLCQRFYADEIGRPGTRRLIDLETHEAVLSPGCFSAWPMRTW